MNQRTARKIKFFIKNFFSKCDQIHRKVISHLLQKSLMKKLFAVTSLILTFSQLPQMVSYVYANLPRNITVRLSHPRSAGSQVQETFLAHPADKQNTTMSQSAQTTITPNKHQALKHQGTFIFQLTSMHLMYVKQIQFFNYYITKYKFSSQSSNVQNSYCKPLSVMLLCFLMHKLGRSLGNMTLLGAVFLPLVQPLFLPKNKQKGKEIFLIISNKIKSENNRNLKIKKYA